MLMNIKDNNLEVLTEDLEYNYRPKLTSILDKLSQDFNQDTINNIVLWKVNRYSELDLKTLELLNSIDKKDRKLNIKKAKEILFTLLKTKGIQIPMASSILRFKNPSLFQIFDQRVYRLIYGTEWKYKNSSKSDNSVNFQIEVYIKYLEDLRFACDKLKINFVYADRILYNLDKRVNKKYNLKNY